MTFTLANVGFSMLSLGWFGVALMLGAALLGGGVLVLIYGLSFIGLIIRIIASVLMRIGGFVAGVVGDVVLIALSVVGAVLSPAFAVFFLVLGRWRVANRFARRAGDSLATMVRSTGRIVAVRPLRLFFLDGAADGIDRRLPGHMPDGPSFFVTREAARTAVVGAPQVVKARKKKAAKTDPNHFDGFTIVGGLRAGGSGAKLHIAEPSVQRRARLEGAPERVVIKCFSLAEESILPSIVRESRALEGARTMGLVLEHHLEDDRFWYVMPYHEGASLSDQINVLHGECATQELRGEPLSAAIGYARDLVETLTRFHAAGLWHKDVKPDNLIVHDECVHLVDLGLVTSLHSPLTLTTHGTEYFRDPELVRMALRGVKVNDIDGAKFDIYGAGAVLYFALENDFPAHGGLSNFSRQVPDSLRWIVRRAMAEYDQRYDTAETMLADLNTVAAAKDPWEVRPVDLPSMRESQASDAKRAPAPPLVHTRVASAPTRSPDFSQGRPSPARRTPRRRAASTPPRTPVPIDRPSGALAMLGMITIVAAGLAIYSLVGNSTPQSLDTFSMRAGATTWTLTAPDDSERVLLVRDVQALNESKGLMRAERRVVESYTANGYILDEEPNTDLLDELQRASRPRGLAIEDNAQVALLFQAHGFTGLCRIGEGPVDFAPSVYVMNATGLLDVFPVDLDATEGTPPTWVFSRPQSNEDGESRAMPERDVDNTSTLLSFNNTNDSERSACPATTNTTSRIPVPSFAQAWNVASSRPRAHSMRWLHVRSRTLGSPQPISLAAQRRMSRAIPTLA